MIKERIQLAEAMGWTKHWSEEWWQSPEQGRFDDATKLPNPFTVANDDYACLIWFLYSGYDSPDLEKHLRDYKVGDFARAVLGRI